MGGDFLAMRDKKSLATRKKTKVVGTKRYIDEETGEIEEMQVIEVEERDANFHKLWLAHIVESLDMIGNQKIKVLTFIMNNLNKENQFIMTQRKMAEKTGIAVGTINATIKALQEADFLRKINSGAYQVNPQVIFKGGKNDRMNVLLQYRDIERKTPNDKEQPFQVIEGGKEE
jgi:5,10-methylene-tetrahydrofolate dehydrogenase/methenyl tetrahydrofolate cyclohydrolase